MFRITEDPSSGSLVQYLAKLTRIGLQYAVITPTMSISTDTIETFL